MAVLLLFWPVGGFEFIDYDDPDYLTQNRLIQRGLTVDGLKWAFGKIHGEVTYWHPLTWVSHMLDCQLFGLNPGVHHRINLLFHLLNTLLVFHVFRRLTGRVAASVVLALLFGLHPLQVDTVAWVSERKNLLSTSFWLLTMLAYLRYVEKPGTGRYLLALLLFGLGLMTKPMLVTLPCVFLLLDFWPFRRLAWARRFGPEDRDGRWLDLPPRSPGRLVLEKLPFVALSIASGVLTILAHRSLGILNHLPDLTFPLRLANAVVSYVRYLGKALWPTNLSILYPHPITWPAWVIAGSVLLLVAISLFILWNIRRRPYLLVGWLWFLGVLFPAIGVLQAGNQAMADRFAYVPVLGLFLIAVWGLADLARSWRWGPTAAKCLLPIVLVALALRTSDQLPHWQDSASIFTHALKVTTNNAIAHNNLGAALFKQGSTDEAMAHYAESIRIDPNYAAAHNNLGFASARKGDRDQAIHHYSEALRSLPSNASTHFNLALLYSQMDQLDKAIDHFQTGLHHAPGDIFARICLADALSERDRIDEALGHYVEVLRLQPAHVEAHYKLGVALAQQGKLAQARPHLSHLVTLPADPAEAYARLAGSLARQQNPKATVACLREALRLQPDAVERLNALAWTLATEPEAPWRDGPEAVRLARRAAELTSFKDAQVLATLAAALAEVGQFKEAAQTAAQGMEVATAAGRTDFVQTNQMLLESFQAGRKYHQPR